LIKKKVINIIMALSFKKDHVEGYLYNTKIALWF